jgi:mono/diheme cytochrome c family protein
VEALPASRAGSGRPSRRSALLALVLAAVAVLVAGCGTLGYAPAGADKANGKKLFIKGTGGKPACGTCHALADAGTTAAIGPDLDAAFAQALKDGETEDTIRQIVRGQIAYSIEQTTTGAPGMPRDLVTGRDADDVAAYVASVAGQGAPAPAPTTPAAPPPTGGGGETGGEGTAGGSAQVAAGKKVFLDAACGGCHTLKDAGSGGQIGPNLDQLKPDKARVARQVRTGGGAMPSFADQLSAKQIDDVATYVSSVAGK